MKVADLTVEEHQALIKKTLHEELQELFADPERVPFEEGKRRYNLR